MPMINPKLIALLLACYAIFVQDCHADTNETDTAKPKAQHLVKLNILESTINSTFNLKCEYEFVTRSKVAGFGIEAGKTFYSVDERVSAKGNFISTSFTFNYYRTKLLTTGIKLKPFYHEIFIHDYLKFERITPHYFQYHEYVKTDYSKLRYGFSLCHTLRQYFHKRFFAEASIGLSLVNYETFIPEGVSQNYFKNGYFNSETYTGPDLFFSIQLGYCFRH